MILQFKEYSLLTSCRLQMDTYKSVVNVLLVRLSSLPDRVQNRYIRRKGGWILPHVLLEELIEMPPPHNPHSTSTLGIVQRDEVDSLLPCDTLTQKRGILPHGEDIPSQVSTTRRDLKNYIS